MRKKNAKRKSKPRREVHEHHMERAVFAILIVLIYLVLAAQKHGPEQGVGITVLTWAFFVLLTPVPSADLVLEIPLRLFTNYKMVVTHVFVWLVGAAVVVASLLMAPELFKSTTLLAIFYHVLTNPVPYWSLLFLCGIGTFMSVHIVDEVLEEVEHELKHHHRKHMPALHIVLFALVFIGILLAYNAIISDLGIGDLQLI